MQQIRKKKRTRPWAGRGVMAQRAGKAARFVDESHAVARQASNDSS